MPSSKSNELHFRNYPGVEDHDTTAREMQSRQDKGHVVAFDSYEELADYVGGKPVLSKIGFIVKTRNRATSTRTILDTTESGVKWITAKTQRVILRRLLDAVLRMRFLLSLCLGATDLVGAFVLDFSDAFWPIPIMLDEGGFSVQQQC